MKIYIPNQQFVLSDVTEDTFVLRNHNKSLTVKLGGGLFPRTEKLAKKSYLTIQDLEIIINEITAFLKRHEGTVSL